MVAIGLEALLIGVPVIKTQPGIGMRIGLSTKACIALVVETTVLEAQMADKRPDLSIMPVDDRVNAHEIGPPVIRLVEMRQLLAVRISASCADEDSPNAGIQGQVALKARADGGAGGIGGVFGHGEMIHTGGRLDELLDVGKRVGWEGVYGRNGGNWKKTIPTGLLGTGIPGGVVLV